MTFSIFTAEKHLCILHGQVLVVIRSLLSESGIKLNENGAHYRKCPLFLWQGAQGRDAGDGVCE